MLKPCRSLLLNIPGIAEMNGLSIGYLRANPAVKAAPSGRWTLCDKAPRSALYLMKRGQVQLIAQLFIQPRLAR